MKGYVVSPRAHADIDEIWEYTADRWGIDQAERYVRTLQFAVETIARDPQKGRSCDDIRQGYRKYRVGSHVPFYRVTPQGVDIVRVLHQRMDFSQHL
jgi:toxin ParE1/3/4